MTVDEALLLEWLREAQVKVGSGVAKAVYSGLEARVRRGDFEARQEAAA